MSIEKSGNYVADVKSRKLFGRLNSEIAALGRQIDNVLTAANGMRLALGAAHLTMAEVEALHVQQIHDRRISDALLFESQSRLSELLDAAKLNTASVGALISKQAPKVDALLTQAKRISERDVFDPEPTGPLEGFEYVDIEFFGEQLGCTKANVRYLIGTGALPPHDTVDGGDGATGRPKLLWLKHKAAVAVQAVKEARAAPKKKGISALV